MGTNWQVVPEAFLSGTFSSVHCLTTASTSANEVFQFFQNHPEVPFTLSRVEGFTQLRDESDHRQFEEVLYRWYLTHLHRSNGPLPSVCLAGGYKTISAALQKAAGLFGASDVFHVLADPNPATLEEIASAHQSGTLRRIDVGGEPGWPLLHRLHPRDFPLPAKPGPLPSEHLLSAPDHALGDLIRRELTMVARKSEAWEKQDPLRTPTMSHTLIHLVSQQTMQNLLPLLALHPRRVVQVRSADPRFDPATRRLQRAAETLLDSISPIEFSEVRLEEPSPSMESTCNMLEDVLTRHPGSVLNLTGGTKPMSIGAFMAARKTGCPVLYCDTQSGSFHSLNAEAPLPGLSGFHDAARILTVEAVLTAHGCDPEGIISVTPEETEVEFGRQVGVLQDRDPEAMAGLSGRLHAQLHPGGKRIRKSQIDPVLAKGLPSPSSDLEHAFFEAAREAGWIEARGERYVYRMQGDTLKPEGRIRAALKILKALTGGWFEYLIYDRMRASGRFGDLRMEVQSSGRTNRAMGENDLMGIDLERLGLVFVSCKVSDAYLNKPLEHTFATRQRSLEFGGAFAQTIFCFHHFTDPNKERIMRDACRAVHARLLVGSPNFAFQDAE